MTQLRSLDLNLLFPLQALLEERHVTRAGVRVGLSQPAMSVALARLRRFFGDDILVRVGNHHELTPAAVEMQDRVTEAASAVQRAFAAGSSGDLAGQRRTFRIWATDNSLVLAPALLARLAERSPGAEVRFVDMNLARDDADLALRTTDGTLAPRGIISGFPSQPVYEDVWCCVASRDHLPGGELTLETLKSRPMVEAFGDQIVMSPPRRALAELGVEPRVVCVVEGFMSLPPLVVGTDRLAFMPRRLATLFRDERLAIRPCPLPMPPLTEMFWWHPTRKADPAHQLLRRVLAEVALELAPEAAAGRETRL